jgi:predicted nucleic acid-binding protein
MSVLVDSSIWSLAFRRKTATAPYAAALADLVVKKQALIIGAVRQEVLSGIRDRTYFERLRDQLQSFADLHLTERHYERAAEIANACRSRGVQGSPTDFLICATAEIADLSIFTTDADFHRISQHTPIRLYVP